MRAQRLSYETAGGAVLPRGVPRAIPPTRLPTGLAAPLQYGRAPEQARQRRVVIATMLLAHGLAVAGLVNASRLRDAVVDAKPIFLAVLDTPAPTAPPRPLPLPPTAQVPPPPQLTLPPIVPDQAPTPIVVQAPPPPALPAPIASVEAPPTPTPASSIAPKTIPAAAVQYLVAPAPVYSRISARMRESGKAVVRVFIDDAGLPRNVQLALSTGFARLDDAALAAIRNCRFKPYLEDGHAVAGWATIPIEFELPK